MKHKISSKFTRRSFVKTGFAGALSEIGFSEDNILLSLLFFNLGIEVGQLLLIPF